MGALLLLLIIALGWLLATPGGREMALQQIAARLPEGSLLHWQRADGVLLGPLVLHDVRYVQTLASGPLEINAQQLTLDLAWWRLLSGQLRLNALTLDHAALILPPPAADATPFTLPQWPELLPEIHLPLTLAVDTIRIHDFRIQQHDAALIGIHSLEGGILARDGEVQVQALHMDSDRGRFYLSGRYHPNQHYRTDLTARARLPGARFGLAIRGDLDALDVALVGHAPERIQIQWSLRNAETWTLSAHSEAFAPGPASAPIAFTLDASGNARQSHWRGHIQQDEWSATLHPATLRLDDQQLELVPSQVDITVGTQIKGQLLVSGDARFSPAHSPEFALHLAGEHWTLRHAAPAITLQGTLDLNGRIDAWQVNGQATATREGQHARVSLLAQGDDRSVRLTTLNARTPGGQLDASGQFTWAPALTWSAHGALDHFDPGYFAPDWPGAINARLASRGHTHADGTVQIEARVDELGGQLRQRALAGMARLTFDSTHHTLQGNADVRLGTSRLHAIAKTHPQLDIEATFSPLHLADLWPEADGEIKGRVHLTGTYTAPDLAVDLSAHHLGWGEHRLTELRARGHLPWQRGEGALTLEASGIDTRVALNHIALHLSGSARRLQLGAEVRAPALTVTTRARVNVEGQHWQASLDAFDLTPRVGAHWHLQSPLALAWTGPRWSLAQGCLASTDHARLCASAEWPQTGLQLEARALPLLLLSPWLQTLLPEYNPGQPWVLRGELDMDANARPSGQRWQGAFTLRSPGGQLRTHEAATRDVISYQDLALDVHFDPEHLRARLDALLPNPASSDADHTAPGDLRARLTTGWDASAPVQGELTLNMRDLTWLELFSADLANPGGQFSAGLALTGTRTAPHLAGHARLHDLTAELPALALHLQQGEITLNAQSDRPAQVNGQIHSGEGALHLRGRFDWRVPERPFTLHLTGENLTAASTRDLKLTIAPDLNIESAAHQPLRVSGSIHVPSALMELERLDSGVPISPDVVVIDPAKPQQQSERSALLLDLNLIMGENVRLRGFGLDGKLGGELRLRAEPGHEMTGSGRLDVSGGYKAYGQALTITRAQLQFTNGPLTDPLIEMSAERKIELEDMTAGITVTGRTSAPEVAVWTLPATDSSQALSWLAFGRSMSSLTSTEAQQFNAAATALNTGGNLLAGQIGRMIGLDDAGITTSRTLGENVFGIGKQISPRLYVGVGVSMIGSGQMLSLKYLLRKGFDIEIESSTLESRGSINWRHEAD